MDCPLIRMIVRRVISGYPASALVTSDYCHAPDWSFETEVKLFLWNIVSNYMEKWEWTIRAWIGMSILDQQNITEHCRTFILLYFCTDCTAHRTSCRPMWEIIWGVCFVLDSSFQLSTSSKNSVSPTLELEDVRWPILILIHIRPRARQINQNNLVFLFCW